MKTALRIIFFLLLLGRVTGALAQCGTVDFTANVTKGCSPLIVTFKAVGAGGSSSIYSWDFGSGPVTGFDSIQKIFTLSGKYNIKLTVKLSSGVTCNVTKPNMIEVLPTPSPSISANPGQIICNGTKTVTFTDNTLDVQDRQWVIDGNTYSKANAAISYTFASAGNKSVALKVTNSYGCTGIFSDNKFEQLHDSAETEFCADVTRTATLFRAKFTAFVNAPGRSIAKYQWSFPGGLPSTDTGKITRDIVYANNKKAYDVTLVVTMTDGCTYTCRRISYIQPYVSYPYDTVCINQVFVVGNLAANNGKSYFGYQFTGADQVDPFSNKIRYTSAGKFDLGFTFKYSQKGCTTNVSYPSYINVIGPKADFSAPDRAGCAVPFKVKFENKSDPFGAKNVKYTWRFYDSNKVELKGSPIGPTANKDTSFIFKADGKYTVKLYATCSNGCIDSVVKANYVTISQPKADFNSPKTTLCLGEKIVITNETRPIEDPVNPYTFLWNIQHADSSNIFYSFTSKTPTFIPTVPGKYHVTLIVNTGNSCGDTIKKWFFFTVYGAIADVTIDKFGGCPPVAARLVSNVKYKYPNSPYDKLTYRWEVSPESDADVWNPPGQFTGVTFNKSGCYDVRLFLYDSKGCTTMVEKRNMMCLGVGSAFDVDSNNCIGDVVNTHNYADQSPDHFKWSVTPASLATIIPSDTVKDPQIIYHKDTTFIIRLITSKTYAGSTCYDTSEKVIKFKLPKADFTTGITKAYCAPHIVTFTNKSTRSQKWFWNFGDGDTLTTTNPNPTHIYKKNNVKGFVVTMIAFDTASGCSDTMVKQGFIKIIGPVPQFSIDKKLACDSVVVHFKNLSSNVKKYLIDYDDGSFLDTSLAASHSYHLSSLVADSMIFHPVMIAKDSAACQAVYRDTIKIYRSSRANFSSDKVEGCVPLTVKFEDKSYNAVKWYWDLDNDGTIDDTAQNPTRTYSNSGKYNVKLISENRAGCVDSTVKQGYITVLDYPTASFAMSAKRICGEEKINFTNLTTSYSSLKISYGDGSPDETKLTSHIFKFTATGQDSQLIVVRLTAFNSTGCSDEYTDTVVAFANPQIDFNQTPSSGCAPLTVNFTDSSTNSVARMWDFENDGINDDKSASPVFTYSPGLHSVKLTATSKYGCTDSLVKTNIIDVNEVPKVDFGASDTVVCMGGTLNFYDKTTPQAKLKAWEWFFNEPKISPDSVSGQNTSFTFFTQGWHNVTLKVWDDKGCKGITTKKAIYVEDTLPPLNADILYASIGQNGMPQAWWNMNKVYDFQKYMLYRDGDTIPVFTSFNRRDTVFYDLDATLKPELQSYCYSIQTMDKCGNISGLSNAHCTIVLEVNPTSPVANTLNWTPYKGWPSVKEYQVYRADSGGSYTMVGTVNGTTYSYIDTGLCDKSYSYYIMAVHPNGLYSTRSNSSYGHPPYVYQQGPIVLKYTTVVDNSAIMTRWSKGTQPNVKYYIIDRYSEPNGWLNAYALSNTTYFIDNKVDVEEKSYTYRIKVEDECGNISGLSNVGTSILLRATIENDKVKLHWNPYVDWAQGVNSYIVQIRGANNSFKTIANLSSSDTVWIDDSIHQRIDTAYCYRLLAVENKPLQDSSISNIACAVLPSRMFIPNAFSPNSDGINDVWKVSALSIYNLTKEPLLNFSMKIYTRWGERIFEGTSLSDGWDGTLDGKKVPEDVYFYVIKAEGIDKKTYFLHGNITLMK